MVVDGDGDAAKNMAAVDFNLFAVDPVHSQSTKVPQTRPQIIFIPDSFIAFSFPTDRHQDPFYQITA